MWGILAEISQWKIDTNYVTSILRQERNLQSQNISVIVGLTHGFCGGKDGIALVALTGLKRCPSGPKDKTALF